MHLGAISPDATPSLMSCLVMGFMIGAMAFLIGVRRRWLVALPLLLGAIVNVVIWPGAGAIPGILKDEGVLFVAARLVALDTPIVLWFAAAVWARRQGTRSDRRAEGLCTQCGYPLRGLHGAMCPECGTLIT
jgi:hypothetical protein